MITADLVLELAVVLLIFVVILAIPRVLVADRESLAALRREQHREQAIHRRLHAHPRVRSIHAHRHDEHRHAAPPVKHAA